MLDPKKGIMAELLQYVYKTSLEGDGYRGRLYELAKELNFDMRFTQKGLGRTLMRDCPPMVFTQTVGIPSGLEQLFLQVYWGLCFRYEVPA